MSLMFLTRRGAMLTLAVWLTFGGGATAPARAEQALVAVAANFAAAARAMAPVFHEQTGDSIKVAIASTGRLRAQIVGGAPYDVMLSADQETPDSLQAVGLVVPGSRFTYAKGKLAIWAPSEPKIGIDPVKALTDPKVRHIAIANPKLAPYGKAAREVLDYLGAWKKVKDKIVMGQNIGQTFAMVQSGGAQIGFIAASSLHGPKAPKGGSVFIVPADDYSAILQDAALLKHGENNPAAKAFLTFLKGPKARAIAARFGYGMP
ncbi:MAG: molybdate ABC transporter substrate-binding protein [Gammaproteobacteria bacterium]